MSKKKNSYKTSIILILALLICIAGVWLYNKSRKEPPKKPAQVPQTGAQKERTPVNVYKATRIDFKDTLLALGTVKGGVEVELRFQKEGVINQFRFKEGDKVLKDEIIAQLDQKDELIKVKIAENDYEQHKKLLQAGAIIPLKLEQVKHIYDQAKLELEKTNLRAPRTGLIANKESEIGEFITPNTRIATLVDMEKVIVEIGIIEKDINKLILTQTVKINFDAYPGFDFYGKVYNIPPDLGKKVPMLQVKIMIENPDALILPGMFARSLIYVYEEQGVLVIPMSAINKSAEEPRVFVVGERNRVSDRAVKIKYSSNEYAVVEQGLEDGEMIVADKPETIKTGDEVEIVEMNEYQTKAQ